MHQYRLQFIFFESWRLVTQSGKIDAAQAKTPAELEQHNTLDLSETTPKQTRVIYHYFEF